MTTAGLNKWELRPTGPDIGISHYPPRPSNQPGHIAEDLEISWVLFEEPV